VGSADLTQVQHPANDSYATRHDPFVYFHSVIDSQSYCNAHVVSLTPLAGNLKHTATTPNYSFITPDTCADGHDGKCTNGQKGGLVQANAFLRRGSRGSRTRRLQGERPDRRHLRRVREPVRLHGVLREKVSTGNTDPSHPNADKPGIRAGRRPGRRGPAVPVHQGRHPQRRGVQPVLRCAASRTCSA
jgi:hypothetical protein